MILNLDSPCSLALVFFVGCLLAAFVLAVLMRCAMIAWPDWFARSVRVPAPPPMDAPIPPWMENPKVDRWIGGACACHDCGLTESQLPSGARMIITSSAIAICSACLEARR